MQATIFFSINGGIDSPIMVRTNVSETQLGKFGSSGSEDTINVSRMVNTRASEYVPSGSS